jgi:hypothetical protein
MFLVPGGVMGCAENGTHWLFSDCTSSLLLYMIHTVATMQTASISRIVFIKSIKDTKETKEYLALNAEEEILKMKVVYTIRSKNDII